MLVWGARAATPTLSQKGILAVLWGPPWASLCHPTLAQMPGSACQGLGAGATGLCSTKKPPTPSKRSKRSLPRAPSLEPGGYRVPFSVHFIILPRPSGHPGNG